MEKEKPKKSPPHAVEGPVVRPEDLDRGGTGGPYGHTVPKADDTPKGRDKKQR
jgi:hypothetical protein